MNPLVSIFPISYNMQVWSSDAGSKEVTKCSEWKVTLKPDSQFQRPLIGCSAGKLKKYNSQVILSSRHLPTSYQLVLDFQKLGTHLLSATMTQVRYTLHVDFIILTKLCYNKWSSRSYVAQCHNKTLQTTEVLEVCRFWRVLRAPKVWLCQLKPNQTSTTFSVLGLYN